MSPRSSSPLTLELILLGLLARQAMHGYDLLRELKSLEGIRILWHVKQSQLYALLERLESEGYLEHRLEQSGAYPPRKVYAVSERGQEVLSRWRQTPVAHPRDMRQDFLARLFFARLAGPETALQLLQSQLDVYRGWQENLFERLAALRPDQDFERLVYRFRLRQVEGMLDWLSDCLAELPR